MGRWGLGSRGRGSGQLYCPRPAASVSGVFCLPGCVLCLKGGREGSGVVGRNAALVARAS